MKLIRVVAPTAIRTLSFYFIFDGKYYSEYAIQN